jgi:hypothetical protein
MWNPGQDYDITLQAVPKIRTRPPPEEGGRGGGERAARSL